MDQCLVYALEYRVGAISIDEDMVVYGLDMLARKVMVSHVDLEARKDGSSVCMTEDYRHDFSRQSFLVIGHFLATKDPLIMTHEFAR